MEVYYNSNRLHFSFTVIDALRVSTLPISADFGGKNKERLFFQILEVSKNKERLFEKPAAGENFWGFEARKT